MDIRYNWLSLNLNKVVMKAKGKILSVVGGIALLASCANYNHISENDVYMQKPSELNAGGDESDLTSFAAFKARRSYGTCYQR